MNFKRVAAGVLAAATVFTASAATFQGGVTLFSQTAITAEAALNNIAIYYSGDIYACNNIKYKLNKSTKEATIYGKTPKNPSGGNVTLKDVVIPDQIIVQKGDFAGTYKVTAIAEKAFKGCELTSIDLRNCWAMKKIYNEAFMNCTKLKTVRLSSAIENMYSSGFQGCTALTTFDFNGNNKITNIPIYFLQGCTALKSVSIPYSVTWIRNGAFSGSGITSVKVSNNVTSVDLSAFAGCKSLNTVTFEAGNSKKLSLGRYAFANCPKISRVNFDRDNIDAEPNAFEDCGICFRAYGYGAQNYAKSICRKLVQQWGIKYKSGMKFEEEMKFYNDLMAKLNKYVSPASLEEQLQEGNTATVISLRKGTCGGYSRLYYLLCREAGVPDDRVLVAGDCHCHAWNYVKIGSLWFNIDATNNVKACNKAGYSYWFGSDPELSNGKHPHRPENWYVLVDDTIGTTDSQQYLHSFTLLFDDLIAHHSEGSVYITGSRA
ncbi:MAG: leucine-rich repeat protein [Ruminococcus sp.]|nr:leucine-rich repeat protein [Ruminococcus sp.]